MQPEGEAGGAFGSLAFPGLRVLTPEVLFGVAEGDLDAPPAGVARRERGASGGQVGAEEKVLGFDPVRVADDDEPDQGGAEDPVRARPGGGPAGCGGCRGRPG